MYFSGMPDLNSVMWMDHRAADQASRITSTQHDVLKYTGGSISLEMQTPKLLWLKEVLLRGTLLLIAQISFNFQVTFFVCPSP